MINDMNIELFKQKVRILTPEDRQFARDRFIHAFIDTNSDWYIKNIQTVHRCSDGECYEGYLWDCLKSKRIIDESQFVSGIVRRHQVFAMWDIHSCDKIPIEGYWHFEKSAVLEMPGHVLAEGISLLPEDLYIFDGSYSWALIGTHEDNGRSRIFLSSRRCPTDS